MVYGKVIYIYLEISILQGKGLKTSSYSILNIF